jgi:hypothetical protein
MKCAACKSALEHIDVQRSPRDDAIRKTKQNMRKLLEVNLRIHGALLRVGLPPWIESRQTDTNSNQNIRSHVQANGLCLQPMLLSCHASQKYSVTAINQLISAEPYLSTARANRAQNSSGSPIDWALDGQNAKVMVL